MSELVQSQTAKRLKKLDREVRNVVRKSANVDADAVHGLRVSIRRLRQELKVFKAWFEGDGAKSGAKSIRKKLRKLMDWCGAVRNCDVAMGVLKETGCQSSELIANWKKERLRAQEELVRKLERWRKEDRIGKWREHLRIGHSKEQESVEEHARTMLPEIVDDLFRAGQQAAQPDSSHQKMHRFRLKTKRARYTLELFEQVYGERAKPILERLKGLQDKLGAINDCAMTLDMIHSDKLAAAAIRHLAGEREAEFRGYWKEHFGPRERLRWKAVLLADEGKN